MGLRRLEPGLSSTVKRFLFHPGGASTGGGASSLINGLRAWYPLDSVRDQVPGSIPLTNNNGVTFTSGLIGNAATFASASSQYLSRAAVSQLDMAGSSFTVAGFVKISDLGVRRTIFSKGNFGAFACEYAAYRETDNRVYFDVGNGSAKSETSGANGLGSGAWKYVLLQYDITSGQIAGSINLGTAVTATIAGGTTSQGLTLQFGANSGAAFMDGQMALWGLWSRLLTTAEKNVLYNSGLGMLYPWR